MQFAPQVRKRMVEMSAAEKMEVWEIARVFAASESGVRRVLQRHRERGTHLPLPRNPGRKLQMTDRVAVRIRDFVASRPDATRQQIKDALGLGVSLQAISEWLRRLGLVLKKSLIAREQDRPDVKSRRDVWHDDLKDTDPDTIVFLDESGARTDMTRTRGRAAKGVRVVEKVPAGHWTTTTMLAAVRTAGPLAGAMVSGATDTDVFLTWLEHALLPALRPGETVVMDNLPPHKSPQVRALIESAGCRLLYLPPYSPDFNPIENLWSKVKSHLRSTAARTYEALQHAVTSALTAVSTNDCRGFFRHCGYDAT